MSDLFECSNTGFEGAEEMERNEPSTSTAGQQNEEPKAPAVKSKKPTKSMQTTIMTTPEKKLTYGKRQSTSSKKKQVPQKKIKRSSIASVVHTLSSTSSDEESEPPTASEAADRDRLNWKLISVHEEIESLTDMDMTVWSTFHDLVYSFYRDVKQKYPLSVLFLMIYTWVADGRNKEFEILDWIMHPMKWQQALPTEFTKEMENTTVKAPMSSGQKTVYSIYSTIVTRVRSLGVMSFEDLQLKHLRDFDDELEGTYPMSLSLMDVRILFRSLMNSDIKSAVLSLQDSSSLQRTATTSTSCTPARTQTRLAVVHGSSSVRDIEELSVDKLEDVFTLMGSNAPIGNTSIDISAQTDMKPSTFKAEVKMKSMVYDIKIYHRDRIRNLEKNKWYTAVKYKVVGTCDEDSPTLKQLLSVVQDTCKDVQQQKNMRVERVWSGFHGQ